MWTTLGILGGCSVGLVGTRAVCCLLDRYLVRGAWDADDEVWSDGEDGEEQEEEEEEEEADVGKDAEGEGEGEGGGGG